MDFLEYAHIFINIESVDKIKNKTIHSEYLHQWKLFDGNYSFTDLFLRVQLKSHLRVENFESNWKIACNEC